MRRSIALIAAGAGIGLAAGSSMGLAVGGTAYNAAYVFVPLGGFIGWLMASKSDAVGTEGNSSENSVPEGEAPDGAKTSDLASLIHAVFNALATIMASAWNFHIDLIEHCGLLPHFVKAPAMFLIVPVAVSWVFPPFALIYVCAWLGAIHFGIKKELGYRAEMP